MSITINKAKQNIIHKINKALGEKIAQESDLVMPSDYNLGDFTYPCFILSKRLKKAPDVIATELSAKIKSCQTVKSVSATGPYLNFNLQPKKLMQVLEDINDNYGRHTFGKNKKIMVEFAQANTHKSFHIGHLRNIIVGESVCRILENAGYAVIRVNYQGDIGMHIAKCLWGITKLPTQLEQVLNSKDINAKVEFLAQAYVKGSGSFEKSQKIKKEIIEINNKIYASDNAIDSLYHQTRKWSLQYLDKIYKRLGVKFDRLYFESETFKPGKDMVEKGIKKNFFQISRDAVIFVGSKHGLHDRVFINSEGNATYEAKEMALAALQLAEFNPDLIIHVVGKEQTEYFKVVTKALEY
ncbi:MAG: arginine--tRNA ligase, partial [Candidatus Magasanikbacteria bacterium CG10_big_fil_rev_8_21_14_0_10_40_10]